MANSTVTGNENEALPAVKRKFRVQLDFSPDDFHELNRLSEKLGMGTRAELFRSALVVLRWMHNKLRTGHSVVAIAPNDGRIIEPEFPFFENVKEGTSSFKSVGDSSAE